MMMNDGDFRVFYAPEFIKDFKQACGKHRGFPEDFDRFLKVLRQYQDRNAIILKDMPDGCKGFIVHKSKKFNCAELKKGSGSGYRIIYSEHRGAVLFIECYFKKNKVNHNSERICRSLKTVKAHTCRGRYVEQTVPNSRFLLRSDCDD